MIFSIDLGFYSFGRKIFIIPVISHTSQIASAPLPSPFQGFAAVRSFICSDDVVAEHEHRLDCVLLEQRPQVLQEQPHCGKESFDADVRHRERSERLVTEPHRTRVGWDDAHASLFVKNFEGKWEGHQWRIQREGFVSGRTSNRYPNF